MSFRHTPFAIAAVLGLLLAGCASQAPVQVEDRSQTSVTAAPPPEPVPVEVPPGYYMVKPGDTLIRISLDNGQNYRDVAAWNNLEDPNRINVGQLLRVVPPEGVAVARPVAAPPAIESAGNGGGAASSGLKQEPVGGAQPYSDEALARLRQGGGKPAEKPQAVPAAVAQADKAPTDKPVPDKTAAAAPEGDWAWPGSGKVLAPFSDSGNKGLDLAGKVGDPVLAAGSGKVVYAGAGLRGYGNLVIVKHDATFLSAYAHNSKILVKEGQSVSKGMKIAEVGSSDADQPKLHFEIRKQGKPVDPLIYLPKR